MECSKEAKVVFFKDLSSLAPCHAAVRSGSSFEDSFCVLLGSQLIHRLTSGFFSNKMGTPFSLKS